MILSANRKFASGTGNIITTQWRINKMAQNEDQDETRKQFLTTRMMWVIGLFGVVFPAIVILGIFLAGSLGLLPSDQFGAFWPMWLFGR